MATHVSLWFASNLLFLHYQSQLKFYIRYGISVVICFEFIIFALSITAWVSTRLSSTSLWFASNLLFLHYQSQLYLEHIVCEECCDLLRIYYFCTINHSTVDSGSPSVVVVICFEFIIFALSITAFCKSRIQKMLLWFASNLLFLHYQSQQPLYASMAEVGCDLLRIYYFCTINHSDY